MTARDFEAVVVGSGFGGSVVTYRLADAGMRVCLLERGRPYPPNSFARTPREMSENVWAPDEGLYGLFDIWTFRHAEALVSAGLGGGSLIYANVLLRKPESWFGPEWPLRRSDLEPHYDAVEAALEPELYPYADTPKTAAFREAATRLGYGLPPTPLAVKFGTPPGLAEPIHEPQPNLHYGAPRTTCRLCGECDVGCNYGSKNTLDYTYLSRAEDTNNARIRTLCEVRAFEPDGDGYAVRYVEHPAGQPVTVTADRLVLAAGSLGTTYLLLRNRSALPKLGPALGTRFSGNGDFLGFALRSKRLLHPSRGPVITSSLEGPDFILQDAGVPAFTLWPFQLEDFPGIVKRGIWIWLRRLWRRLGGRPPSEIGSLLHELLGDCRLSAGSLPLLGMGLEQAAGTLGLEDGQLEVDWDESQSRDYYRRIREAAERVARELGAEYEDNLAYRFGRRLITVHPLGGCPMSDDPRLGVVGSDGQAHGHPRLYVVDGSIMPGPVGPNPSLTIAAVANRIANLMLGQAP